MGHVGIFRNSYPNIDEDSVGLLQMIIREAVLGDEGAIMHLIHELAIYEKAPEEVFATA